jgi:hypothetical protein
MSTHTESAHTACHTPDDGIWESEDVSLGMRSTKFHEKLVPVSVVRTFFEFPKNYDQRTKRIHRVVRGVC